MVCTATQIIHKWVILHAICNYTHNKLGTTWIDVEKCCSSLAHPNLSLPVTSNFHWLRIVSHLKKIKRHKTRVNSIRFLRGELKASARFSSSTSLVDQCKNITQLLQSGMCKERVVLGLMNSQMQRNRQRSAQLK